MLALENLLAGGVLQEGVDPTVCLHGNVRVVLPLAEQAVLGMPLNTNVSQP